MHKVFLALGANVGNKLVNIRNATSLLKEKVKKVQSAKIYKTRPLYYFEQDFFLNTAIKGYTKLQPNELLFFIKEIEQRVGRVKKFRNGPREIDIDILFYDDLILKDENLEIPHPRLQERDFALKPLSDLEPAFVHPLLKKSIIQLLGELSPEGRSIF